MLTVPLGVRVNRQASPPTLYWIFTGVFSAIGLSIVLSWLGAV